MTGLADIDLTDLATFADGFPHALFALHRREAPVHWHEPTEYTPDGEGFWSVATYAETLAVLRDPQTFSSERGGERTGGGTLLQDLEMAGRVLNMMDDPRHNRIRRLVSAGLTPRTITRVEEDLRERTRRLLDTAPHGEPFDFLNRVAAELPMQMICLLLGIPETERHWLFEVVEPLFDFKGSRRSFDPPTAEQLESRQRMHSYGTQVIAQKRAHPTDDMLSAIVHATLPDMDPPQMSDEELYLFFSLLFSAGAETTRNAIAGGLVALIEHPDQLAALRADPSLVGGAVEEILRWTTPSPSKRRTATVDCELGGHSIAAGDKVLVWEASANRDPLQFPDADTFDVTRSPNAHLGFGHGIHFCLGASLARLEIRTVLEELLPRFDAISLAAPVEWTQSNRHTGIRRLQVVLDRRPVGAGSPA